MRIPVSPHLTDPEQHGCGLVIFPDALQPELDQEWLDGWVLRRQQQEPEEYVDRRVRTDMHEEYIIDEDGNYINRGGYKFTPEQFMQAPGRLVGLKHGADEEDLAFVERIDALLAECLRVYMRLYPEVRTSIWWRTPSHVAMYGPGMNLGPHSDQNYERGNDEWNLGLGSGEGDRPVTEFPIHNVVTTSIVLKDECEGGELFFPHAGVTRKLGPGSVAMYPSSYTGAHGVKTVTAGERISYLQFYCQGTPASAHSGHVDAWLEGPINDRHWVPPLISR